MGREISVESAENGYILTNVEHPYGDRGGYHGKRVVKTFKELVEFLERYYEAQISKEPR